MTFVITKICDGVCDTACVPVCPVDCIYGPYDNTDSTGENVKDPPEKGFQLYIDPDECIDCGACEPECPVEAIYDEDTLASSKSLEKYMGDLQRNADFFND